MLDDELARRLRDTADGFQRLGAEFWPGADHFVLLEIDLDGSSTGDARVVCRVCVREAAGLVATQLQSHGDRLLDLEGVSTPQDERCSLCGSCPGA